MKYEKPIKNKIESNLSQRLYAPILKYFEHYKVGKLLDVGCARGVLANKFKKLRYDVHTCDRQPPDFKTLNFKKVNLNETRLPYDNNSFDYIIMSEVIEHLENPRNIIKEISRIIRNEGVFVMTTPHLLSIPQRVYFMLTGRFLHFQDGYSKYGHKCLLPLYWIEEEFIMNKLEIKNITYDRSTIPLINNTMKPSFWFGDHLIIKAKKIE